MTDQKNRLQRLIKTLFYRYRLGKSDAQERKLVERIYEHIGKDNVDQLPNDAKAKSDMWDNIRLGIAAKRIRRRRLTIGIAAALVPLLLATLAVFRYTSKAPQRSDQYARADSPVATLHVKHGKTYQLDSTRQSQLGVKIIDGAQVVSVSQLPEGEKAHVGFTMSNPTKTPYSLVLNDGSQIWLNHGATITFEQHAETRLRQADITGEVYFHVASLTDRHGKVPFRVKTPLQTIEVLGTEFHVDARDDLQESVELLEGRIKLSHNQSQHQTFLSPGEQAFIRTDEAKIFVASSQHPEKIRAWKRGLFYFESDDITDVINELSRWYDVPVVLDPGVENLQISAVVKRYASIMDVLQLIEMTNHIRVEPRGDEIYILRSPTSY